MFTGYKFTTVAVSFPEYFINAKAPLNGAFAGNFTESGFAPG